jgi:manganese transport system permease protein
MDVIIEPLRYDFMVRAVVISALVGLVCALLSCFLVLKRWSLIGDAVSHSVLPGVVVAYMLGLPFSVGAFVFGLGGVLGIGYIKEKVRLKEDAVIGVVYTTLFALGLVLVSKVPSNIDLMHVLFGYVLGISNGDAWQIAVISLAVIGTVLALRRSLLLYCFDPAHARAIHIRVKFYHYLLLVLLALTVVAAVQTVGVILVIAMLILPGATAHLATDKFDRMLAVAAGVSVVACIAGAYASYYFDISTGGAMVLVLAVEFFAVFIGSSKYGLRARRTPQHNSKTA